MTRTLGPTRWARPSRRPARMGLERLHAEGAGESPEAVAPDVSLLPAQILQPGEIIILMLKPSIWFIVLESLRFLIGLTLCLAAALILQQRGYYLYFGHQDMILLAIGLACVRLLWQFFDWLGRVYVLTDRRVITSQGIARVHIFEARLQQIQHTNLDFSLRENLFGLGTISFNTSGTGATESFWRMIAHPQDVHQKVVAAINRYK